MKKSLLCCFLLFSMIAGQMMAQSQLCRPELTWGAYACISKVEINGMVSESSTTPEGWNGEIGSNTYDETVMYADYTLDKDRVVKLEPGKEYELKITVCNFSSGAGDEYYVTAFFDWNGDSQLTASETAFQKSIMVGLRFLQMLQKQLLCVHICTIRLRMYLIQILVVLKMVEYYRIIL